MIYIRKIIPFLRFYIIKFLMSSDITEKIL